MILARTSAQRALVFPFIFPAGLLDIVEEPQDWWQQEPAILEPGEPRSVSPVTSYMEVHTFGGWVAMLKALVIGGGTVHDQRQLYARFFDLPLIAYRLMNGGVGLINPANITRLSAWPAPDALPSELLRWTSAFGRGGKLIPSAFSDSR